MLLEHLQERCSYLRYAGSIKNAKSQNIKIYIVTLVPAGKKTLTHLLYSSFREAAISQWTDTRCCDGPRQECKGGQGRCLISIRTLRIRSSPTNAHSFLSRPEKQLAQILFAETSPLDLKRKAPLFGILQLVHSASQIRYSLIES